MRSNAPRKRRDRRRKSKGPPYATAALAAAAGGLAMSALLTHLWAKQAEKTNPPHGRVLAVRGVRLHYVERGEGEPLVLLHGNGSMVQDFEASGLIDLAAKTHRVIAFDRPGYGYSDRPRGTIWTAQAQADLVHAALLQLGVERAIVLGHSWGASLAVALGLRHPDVVCGLVLASGYYFPGVRSDVIAASGLAVPVIGDVLRHTVFPMIGRLLWPRFKRRIFSPAPVPPQFEGFPIEMVLRPSAVRTSATESALMIANAFALRAHYRTLTMPVAIIAGEADRIVDTQRQSARLHGEIVQSTFDTVPGAGHMVHQSHTARVKAAVDAVSATMRRLAGHPSRGDWARQER